VRGKTPLAVGVLARLWKDAKENQAGGSGEAARGLRVDISELKSPDPV